MTVQAKNIGNIGISNVYNMDCIDFMRGINDDYFDLAIADPPYGLKDFGAGTHGAGKLKNRILNSSNIDRWDSQPSQLFFDELTRVSKNVIIWGGNYFKLTPTRCFVVWDKKQPFKNFSQAEYAWTTFNKPAKIFKFDNRRSKKIHPTQKPIELYDFLLSNFAKEGDKIFDPMMGSQSSRISCYKLGFDFYGCEVDEEYFRLGNERFLEFINT